MSNHSLSKLQEAILVLSHSQDWPTARQEWHLERITVIDPDEPPQTCPCGQCPIREVCTIRNHSTGHSEDVGNVCVHQFLGIKSNGFFDGVRRIVKDFTKSVGEAATLHFHEKRVITDWEKNFNLDTLNKKRLSNRQLEFRMKINNKIIAHVTRKPVKPITLPLPTNTNVADDDNVREPKVIWWDRNRDLDAAANIRFVLTPPRQSTRTNYNITTPEGSLSNDELAVLTYDGFDWKPERTWINDYKQTLDHLVSRITNYRHLGQPTPFDSVGDFVSLFGGPLEWRWFARQRPSKLSPHSQHILSEIRRKGAING